MSQGPTPGRNFYDTLSPVAPESPPQVLVIGFGLPGREVVNSLIARGITFCVVEANPDVVTRCQIGHLHIMKGDARDPAVLEAAGIASASHIAITIPDEEVVLDIVASARRLNPTIQILARCVHVSAGMEAHRRGANDVIVAEQIVAREFSRLIAAAANSPEPSP